MEENTANGVKKISLTIRVSAELHRKMKIKQAETGTETQQVGEYLLTRWVEGLEPDPPNTDPDVTALAELLTSPKNEVERMIAGHLRDYARMIKESRA